MEVEFKEKSLCERIDLVYEKLTEAQKQIPIEISPVLRNLITVIFYY